MFAEKNVILLLSICGNYSIFAFHKAGNSIIHYFTFTAMIEIKEYIQSDMEEIIELVLHCQNDGTRPLVTVEDQPELLHIKEKYFNGGGNFWVAKENGKVAGTIGLLNEGNGLGILKKFFVYEPYRGTPHYLGSQLYTIFLDFAKKHNFKKIILDTPKNTDRAHKFYEKNGFKKIEKKDLPIDYDYPYAETDCDFFYLDLL